MNLLSPLGGQFRKFLGTCDPCGTGSVQTGNATPACLPVQGSLICDDRYYSLTQSQSGKLLIVPHGSNCQAFLVGAAGARGFLFYGSDGQVYIENAPKLLLPLVNPAVDGVFPDPGFTYLMVGTGPDPTSWMFAKAPSVGRKTLIAKNGQFDWQDEGEVAGVSSVCAGDSFVALAKLVGCVQTGVDEEDNPVFALRKLTVSHERLIVGFIDGETGEQGYKSIPLADFLKHSKANFTDVMQCGKFGHVNEEAAVAGGIQQLPQQGEDAVEDSVLACFSPTEQRFYRTPARTMETMQLTLDVTFTEDNTWQPLGGHAILEDITFTHPNAMVIASVRMTMSGSDAANANWNMDLGLFVDGVLHTHFHLKGSKDNTVHTLVTDLEVGEHTVEIRVKRPNILNQTMHAQESNMDCFSVI